MGPATERPTIRGRGRATCRSRTLCDFDAFASVTRMTLLPASLESPSVASLQAEAKPKHSSRTRSVRLRAAPPAFGGVNRPGNPGGSFR